MDNHCPKTARISNKHSRQLRIQICRLAVEKNPEYQVHPSKKECMQQYKWDNAGVHAVDKDANELLSEKNPD
jgi:hypothetical protein